MPVWGAARRWWARNGAGVALVVIMAVPAPAGLTAGGTMPAPCLSPYRRRVTPLRVTRSVDPSTKRSNLIDQNFADLSVRPPELCVVDQAPYEIDGNRRKILSVTYQASRTNALIEVTYNDGESSRPVGGGLPDADSLPLVIATMQREEGITGVHTHVRQLRQYLEGIGMPVTFVTSFSWGRALTYPVFGARFVLEPFSKPASIAWHRHWHAAFLYNALRQRLAEIGECVIYAQGPLTARTALRARRGPQQRVIMAVHFRISEADEWADKKQIKRDGMMYRAIRQVEREVIPQVDGLVFVSEWGRNALLSWLPEAGPVPYAVIGNFVAPLHVEADRKSLGDLVTVGNLDLVKNHRFLLQVLAEAKGAGRSLTLDVFGMGPCRKDLLQQRHSLGLQEEVRLHGFRPDVRSLLPRYRAYVHASYSESLPLAIIEAMAAGLPIVAGDSGGISELCDDGVEARFWPLDDPAQAAATLIDLLDCEPARAKAARAASERFHRDFDADVVAPRLLSFLLGKKPQAPGTLR
jgi:glycosyltransferase involved in cell wall biosynthesis